MYYTCFQALYGSFASAVSFLVEPYGYSTLDISIIAGSFLIFGVAASFISGAILDRTKKFKLLLLIYAIVTVIGIALCFYTLPSGNVILFSINVAVNGMSIIPVIPLGFAYSVQITYPIPETMSNGIMLMVAQFVTFVVALFITSLADNNPLYAVAVFSALSVISLVMIIFSTEDLRLQRAQGEAKFLIGSETNTE
mmetsp:Transcript_11085/g.11178  ORF Transcript_11085/g.11178 Transcript_11085/m.11178 type:complete len:196 (-) Transcript_11085:41-628(-)